jgi:rhodanese-related sulfurtransferase
MNDISSGTIPRRQWRVVHSILWEALLVMLACVAFAVVANQLSPRGLRLTRNYFPAGAGASRSVVRALPAGGPMAAGAVTNAPSSPLLPTPSQANGRQMVASNQVLAWFADPRRLTQHIVFVDARNREEYLQGHVPGAWLFDPYDPEKYFPTVLPVLQAAEIIVVYCHGGKCDDSLTAATLLEQVGLPGGKIYVYGGGMDEWAALRQPEESGPQNSGQIHKAGP